MNARSSPGAPTTKSAVSGSLPEGAIFAGRYRALRDPLLPPLLHGERA